MVSGLGFGRPRVRCCAPHGLRDACNILRAAIHEPAEKYCRSKLQLRLGACWDDFAGAWRVGKIGTSCGGH